MSVDLVRELGQPLDEERRLAIIRLLETRDDHLPLPIVRASSASGFVNEPRPRTCPDCLANGGPMAGCETCGGSGVVQPAELVRLAAVDELPDDGLERDPYARNEQAGFDPTRHDEAHARDRQIEVLAAQTRPPRSEVELLEEANRRGYAWEETRRTMYRRFDYGPLDVALDWLRGCDEAAYHALHAVFVYAWLRELSPAAEVAIERGLVALHGRLPDPLRAPGLHPAVLRIRRKSGRGS